MDVNERLQQMYNRRDQIVQMARNGARRRSNVNIDKQVEMLHKVYDEVYDHPVIDEFVRYYVTIHDQATFGTAFFANVTSVRLGVFDRAINEFIAITDWTRERIATE